MNISSIKSVIAKTNFPSSRVASALLLISALGFTFLPVSTQKASAGLLAATTNLVRNASFEKDTDGDGVPNRWAGFNLTLADKRDCNNSYAGNCSFKMVVSASTKQLNQYVPVSGVAGDIVDLSVWTKGKDIDLGYDQIRVNAAFINTNGTSTWWFVEIPAGTTPWTLRQVSAEANQDFESVLIRYQVSGIGGKVWVDKVKLVGP